MSNNPIPLSFIPEIKEVNDSERKNEDNSNKGNCFFLCLRKKWKKASLESNPQNSDVPKKRYFFADEIKINDQTVLTIPLENMFNEEDKPKRKSRWGDKPEKKSKN